jgi:hypothetical protein
MGLAVARELEGVPDPPEKPASFNLDEVMQKLTSPTQ